MKQRFFHHGCCIGADAQAHKIAVSLGFVKASEDKHIVLWPPINTSKMAFDCIKEAYIIKPSAEYLARNWSIAGRAGQDLCFTGTQNGMTIEQGRQVLDLIKGGDTIGLIATPAGFQEEQRSGTWATIRYARKMNHHIYIVYSNGHVREELPR